jgi:hypothetical protein
VFAENREGPYSLDEGTPEHHAELGELLKKNGVRLHLVG